MCEEVIFDGLEPLQRTSGKNFDLFSAENRSVPEPLLLNGILGAKRYRYLSEYCV